MKKITHIKKFYVKGLADGYIVGTTLFRGKAKPTVIHFTSTSILPQMRNGDAATFRQILRDYNIPRNLHEEIVRQVFGRDYVLYDLTSDFNLFRLDDFKVGNYIFKVTS